MRTKFAPGGARKESDDFAQGLEQPVGLHRARSAPIDADVDSNVGVRRIQRVGSAVQLQQIGGSGNSVGSSVIGGVGVGSGSGSGSGSGGGGSGGSGGGGGSGGSGGGGRRSGTGSRYKRTLILCVCLVMTYAIVHAILSPRWNQLVDDNKGALQQKVANLQARLRETKGRYDDLLKQRGKEHLTAAHGGIGTVLYTGERVPASELRIVMSRAVMGIIFFLTMWGLKMREQRSLDAKMLHVPLQDLVDEADAKFNQNAHFLDPFDLMRSEESMGADTLEEQRLMPQ
jgi:hypothetical protein